MSGLFGDDTFTVTEQHLALLKRANVRWEDCEFGAPAIDCKRPYGDSDVLLDMSEILDLDITDKDGDRIPAVEAELTRIHKETGTALQIALAVGYFKVGKYACPKYTRDWREASA
jgi:hypothetical protein